MRAPSRRRGTAPWALAALALLALGLPSLAVARKRPTRKPAVSEPLAGDAIPPPVKAAIEAGLAAVSGRSGLTLDRLWQVRPAKAQVPAVVLVAARAAEGPGGLLALATRPADPAQAPTIVEHLYLPHLADVQWRSRPSLDVDGDDQPDLILGWQQAHRGLARTGLIIVRTAPVALTRIELGTRFRQNVTEVPVACFAPLIGERTRLLALHRISDGRDGFELLFPHADGHWRAGRLFAGVLGQHLDDADARRRYWQGLGPKRARRHKTMPAQGELGACPAEGLLIPSRVLEPGAPGWAVLGPLSRQSSAVGARIRKRKAARAALIIGLGPAEAP